MCKEDLALNNIPGLICYKTQPNQIKFTLSFVEKYYILEL